MVLRLRRWTYKFYSVFSISRTKTMNLEKCYFRHIQEEDKIDITFLFKVKDSMRQFNFSRKPTENLLTLFTRISTNVQKAVNKANKKKKKEDDLKIEVNFYDVKNNPIPEQATCQELFSYEGPLKLKVYDQEYEAIFNAPWIVSINLPQSILAGFPIYPENFCTYYTEKQTTIFNWYRGLPVNENGNVISDCHIKWDLVGNGFTYIPTAQDIGMKLKLECIPGNKTATGPAVEIISKNKVEAGPGKCPFESRHMFTKSKLSGKSFRCVSYNILADLYCDSDFTRTVLHPYCPPYALHIDYRKQLIMKELLGYNADIMCLQEVDRKIFVHCLQPFFEMQGLNGSFYKKGKEVAEGLACFYRKDRFKLLTEENIILSQALQTEPCLNSIWTAIKDNQPLNERLLDRSTAASATILQSLDNDNEILVVGNTHLYFHPDADHIRLIQGGIVIYWLKKIRMDILNENSNKKVSLLLCGDFNSVPSCGIYQLYTTGISPSSLPDWKSNKKEAVYNLTLEQDIPLDSACGTPQYTNFTAGFADCLDYIFYDKRNLTVEQVVPFPSVEELEAHTALPSIVFPSDHIALISDLRFICK
ncbi:2',5'-phosphodiesterase 12 [Pectinophora gossypiella]|uniref:2',5'-phosphodiesterase 12 n=1 Tax=Pectinophora gossypiella TaxID=13191 RepID=UPI00214DF4BA|nr:2',5'-phosphodiesterase 12 [Pectinophora gossypiella]